MVRSRKTYGTVGSGVSRLRRAAQMVVEEVIVDGSDNVDITPVVPIESEPTTKDSVTATSLTPSFDGYNRHGKLRYSWAVDLGPFKLGRIARQ